MPDATPPARIVLTTTATPDEVARLDDLPRRPENQPSTTPSV